MCQQCSEYSVGCISGASQWTCDWLLRNCLQLLEVTLAKLNYILIQDTNVQRPKCDIMDDYALLMFNIFIKHLRPRNKRVVQIYSNNNWLYGRHTLKSVWRRLTTLTCCDSLSPNRQNTNMANSKKEYTNIACDKSMWSPQLCQMKHIFVSCYSVTSSVFEGNRQSHAVSNSVEVDL
jgi:hypothetical protein